MGLSKGQSLPNQGVGNLCGGKESLSCGALHPVGVDTQRANDTAGEDQAIPCGIDRIKERPLILLQVAVIAERKALQQGQHVCQPAQHSAASDCCP